MCAFFKTMLDGLMRVFSGSVLFGRETKYIQKMFSDKVPFRKKKYCLTSDGNNNILHVYTHQECSIV